MNVQQSSMAVATQGKRKNPVGLVLWQEATTFDLGVLWEVRFQAPQLSTRTLQRVLD